MAADSHQGAGQLPGRAKKPDGYRLPRLHPFAPLGDLQDAVGLHKGGDHAAAPGQGGGEDGLDAHAAGGLPRQGDGVRVAPKGGDVLLDPVQGENLSKMP